MENDSKFLRISKKLLLLVGNWPLQKPMSYGKCAYKICCDIVFGLYIAYMASVVIGWKYLIGKSVEKQANDIQYGLTYLLVIWVVLLSKSVSIRKLIEIVAENENPILNSNDEGVKKIYYNCIEYNNKMFYLNLYGILLIYIEFTWTQVLEIQSFTSIDSQTNSTVSNRALPILQWVPFDIDNNFKALFCFQFIMRLYAAFLVLTSYTLITSIINFPVARLQLLGYNLLHFDKRTDGDVTPRDYLRALILEHKAIIEYVGVLNENLKVFLSADFFSRSYRLTFVVMNIMKVVKNMTFNVNDMVIFLFLVSYFVFLLTTLTTIYYSCNELIIQCFELGNNILHSKWYQQSPEIRRSLFIVLLRSQRPLEFRIANLYTINNDLLVGFIKATYTYITWSLSDA